MKTEKGVKRVMKNEIGAIVLAAGKGTRMKSELPKVIHEVGGFPLVAYPLFALKELDSQISPYLVLGFGKEKVEECLSFINREYLPKAIVTVLQKNQNGTGDAVRLAMEKIQKRGEHFSEVLILNGDVPLIDKSDLRKLINYHKEKKSLVTVLGTRLKNPGKLGRLVKDSKENLIKITEYEDASEEVRRILEVNGGIYCIDFEFLSSSIHQLQSKNRQKEFYLTDLVEIASKKRRGAAQALCIQESLKLKGVNDRVEKSVADRALRIKKAWKLMEAGVDLLSPSESWIDWKVEIGKDTRIWPDAVILGETAIGSGCEIQNGVRIESSKISDGVVIKQGTVIEGSVVWENAVLGPYAHLRPETEIGKGAKVGNFVEMKKTKFGAGAKASHLSYLGDAEVGEETNIGCGFITCNYTARREKHQTKIGKNVFLGSDCQAIAPVTIEDNSIVASGTTITRNVKEGDLAISRTKQENKSGYAKRYLPKKKKS